MKYWLISDTHFGHDKTIEFCGRPENFNELLLKGLNIVPVDSIFIHLGDICIGNDYDWHRKMFYELPRCRKILVRGNHDKKSNSWYYEIGWDFVCEQFRDTIFGKDILFSHVQVKDEGYDFNIHGHFHNSNHRRQEPQYTSILSEKNLLYAPETENYKPVNLEKFIVERFGGKG